MSEDILNYLNIRIETARVLPYNEGRYARVQKFVPRDWQNKEVVILTREDFNKLVKYVDSLIDLVEEVMKLAPLEAALDKAFRERAIAKNAVKIKLTRDDFSIKFKS